MPHHAKELTKHSWSTVAIGQHHAICLEQEQGEVFALGRQEYGRLGLGEEGSDATAPTRVDQLSRCIEVRTDHSLYLLCVSDPVFESPKFSEHQIHASC